MVFKKSRSFIIHSLVRLPILRKVAMKVDVARFARTLSTLLRSGVQITTALDVASDTLGQPGLRRRAKEFAEGVSKGASLSNVLSSVKGTFPLVVIQTIKAGEKTGRLDEVLEELANFYESEVENDLKRLTSLLEPLMMLVIGVAVGAMVILVIAPIYSIVGSLQSSIRK